MNLEVRLLDKSQSLKSQSSLKIVNKVLHLSSQLTIYQAHMNAFSVDLSALNSKSDQWASLKSVSLQYIFFELKLETACFLYCLQHERHK